MSLLARIGQQTLRTTGRRSIVNMPRPQGPGAEHTTVVTEHLPFSYGKKRAFGASLAVFATIGFGLPVGAIYLRWHKPGGLFA